MRNGLHPATGMHEYYMYELKWKNIPSNVGHMLAHEYN